MNYFCFILVRFKTYIKFKVKFKGENGFFKHKGFTCLYKNIDYEIVNKQVEAIEKFNNKWVSYFLIDVRYTKIYSDGIEVFHKLERIPFLRKDDKFIKFDGINRSKDNS